MNLSQKLAVLRREWIARELEVFDEIVFRWTESPIEQLFAASAFALGWRVPYGPEVHRCYEMQRRAGIEMGSRFLVSDEISGMIVLQAPVRLAHRNARIDFALLGFDDGKRIAVELDGHDFHERTKEQAKRDKSRDRAFVAAGWLVLRFTGSEVFADPDGCFQQCAELIRGELP